MKLARQVKRLKARLRAWWHRETDHDALDLIQGLVDVVRAEQGLREEMQRELRVMQRQVVELRLHVFEMKPKEEEARMVSIQLPRLDAAMTEAVRAQAFKAKEN